MCSVSLIAIELKGLAAPDEALKIVDPDSFSVSLCSLFQHIRTG